jgi:hypothetical protein
MNLICFDGYKACVDGRVAGWVNASRRCPAPLEPSTGA